MEERLMVRARKRAGQRRRAKSLMGSMRYFLTPEVFKQVRNASKRRKFPRWDLHPLLWILLLTTYCCGDNLPEKFEAARGFYVVCCPKRKRPGKSFSGFEKAITKLPMPDPAGIGGGNSGPIRRSIFREKWKVGNFIPFGCDGTRQNCPRTEELERRLGSWRQRELVADDLEYVDCPSHLGHSFLLAFGQREQAQRAKPLDLRCCVGCRRRR